MKIGRQLTPRYNVQTAVDAKHALIVAHTDTFRCPAGQTLCAALKYRIFGHPRFLLRGLAGAQTEINLATLVYNLKRMLNVLGSLSAPRCSDDLSEHSLNATPQRNILDQPISATIVLAAFATPSNAVPCSRPHPRSNQKSTEDAHGDWYSKWGHFITRRRQGGKRPTTSGEGTAQFFYIELPGQSFSRSRFNNPPNGLRRRSDFGPIASACWLGSEPAGAESRPSGLQCRRVRWASPPCGPPLDP